MNVTRQFRQRLLIERTAVLTEDGEPIVNDRNQESVEWRSLGEVPGLIQPKTAQEMAQFNEAGAVVSDHTAFLPPTDLREADRLRLVPDDGRIFEITGIRDAAGLGHHLEVDARVVTP